MILLRKVFGGPRLIRAAGSATEGGFFKENLKIFIANREGRLKGSVPRLQRVRSTAQCSLLPFSQRLGCRELAPDRPNPARTQRLRGNWTDIFAHSLPPLPRPKKGRIGSGCGALRSLPVYVVLKKRGFRDNRRKTFSVARSESLPQRGFRLLTEVDDGLKVRASARKGFVDEVRQSRVENAML